MVLRPLTERDTAELRRTLSEPEVARWWDEPEEDFPLGDDPDSTRLVIEVDGAIAPARGQCCTCASRQIRYGDWSAR